VTSSILPIVEDYAKHSEAVWEGSKFWKQFFEASANVSLSSYAQAAEEEDDGREGMTVQGQDEIQRNDQHGRNAYDNTTRTNAGTDDTVASINTNAVERYDDDLDDTQAVHSPSMDLNLRNVSKTTAPVAEYPSPYEALKREMDAAAAVQKKQPTTTATSRSTKPPTTASGPATPGHTQTRNRSKIPAHLHSIPAGAASSPFQSPARNTNTNADPLLHRVLDKNYRVQATPRALTKATQPMRGHQAHIPTSAARNSILNKHANPALDSSPFSPALPEAPRLRAEIFGSPVRRGARQDGGNNMGPRTPGVSVQRVRRSGMKAKTTRTPGTGALAGGTRAADNEDIQQQDYYTYDDFNELDDTDDSFDFGVRGMSPPKTLQFHIPSTQIPSNSAPDHNNNPPNIPVAGGGKGTVLATPARLASRRIVEDLLFTAGLARGAEETTTLESGAQGEWDLGFGEEGEVERGDEEEEDYVGRKEQAMTGGDTGLLRGMGHSKFRNDGDRTPLGGGFEEEEGYDDEGLDGEDDDAGEMESPSVVRVARGGFGGRADDVF